MVLTIGGFEVNHRRVGRHPYYGSTTSILWFDDIHTMVRRLPYYGSRTSILWFDDFHTMVRGHPYYGSRTSIRGLKALKGFTGDIKTGATWLRRQGTGELVCYISNGGAASSGSGA
jgi:hypothetical protein